MRGKEAEWIGRILYAARPGRAAESVLAILTVVAPVPVLIEATFDFG